MHFQPPATTRRAAIASTCLIALAALVAFGCSTPTSTPTLSAEPDAEATGTVSDLGTATLPGARSPVTIILDWVPNTNHTGLYVADREGYFEAAGLDVTIVQPGEVYGEQAVVGGAADFAISFQEGMTLARAQGVPVVSVAAILQHNTSAFAVLAEHAVSGPADLAGLRYGAFGSPSELPTLQALIACDGGAPEAAVQEINVGLSDPLALLAERRIDAAWVFEGWQGFQAEQQDIALDLIRMSDYLACVPDYYTPILIATEETVTERPELVRAFVGATARGYADAIADPDAAAEALLAAAPELDPELVQASQAWISPRYQDDAPRWGEQSAAVWNAYSVWLAEQGVIEAPIDAAAAFTNAFLPPIE